MNRRATDYLYLLLNCVIHDLSKQKCHTDPTMTEVIDIAAVTLEKRARKGEDIRHLQRNHLTRKIHTNCMTLHELSPSLTRYSSEMRILLNLGPKNMMNFGLFCQSTNQWKGENWNNKETEIND